MCCFSYDGSKYPGGRPLRVKGTHIFGRGLPDGRQFLVYNMQYSAPVELAMVLPLPTPPNSAEDAVRFIDLSGYAEFFHRLERGFRASPAYERATATLSSKRLDVHDVGGFEASFVPTQKDFTRLDPRFRLPQGALERLPQYRDHGFAVFKLKQDQTKIHPMAFSFPRRDRGGLFFPTVHVHDGTVPEEAAFDHVLYCQDAKPGLEGWQTSRKWLSVPWHELSAAERETHIDYLRTDMTEEQALEGAKAVGGYRSTPSPAKDFMDCARAKGIVAEESPVTRLVLRGLRPNADTLVPT